MRSPRRSTRDAGPEWGLASFWARYQLPPFEDSKRGGGVIKMVDVYRSFGANRVLRGCTFDVQDGETLSIIGGSGTGKNVTIKLIGVLFQPHRGRTHC